jgi:hypothetical protein
MRQRAFLASFPENSSEKQVFSPASPGSHEKSRKLASIGGNLITNPGNASEK